MSLPNIDLPFDVPEIKPEYVPYAYGVLAIGALILVRNPKNILTAISAYFTWKSLVDQGKQSVSAK